MYYKLNSLAKRSWSKRYETSATTMNTRDVKDGVMNFLRELSLDDRRAWAVNLKPAFNFDSWLSALESSAEQDSNPEFESQSTDAQLGEPHFMLELSNIESFAYMDSLDQLASMSPMAGIFEWMSEGVNL